MLDTLEKKSELINYNNNVRKNVNKLTKAIVQYSSRVDAKRKKDKVIINSPGALCTTTTAGPKKKEGKKYRNLV